MKSISGIVISKNNLKTVTVGIVRHRRHPKYKKVVSSNSKVYAHYENMEVNLGDTVNIRPTRPFSATKRFLVVEVRAKAK